MRQALKGLIGFTGFVGGTLCRQQKFDCLYNSKNIAEIDNKKFDLVVCAGAPAVKWQANKEPEADKRNLENLVSHIATIEAKRFVLISTVDVYPQPVGVDELTIIDESKLNAYGKHRLWLEKRVREQFAGALTIRLPGLFGVGLKKNPIFDLMHDNALNLIHKDSRMQFYNLDNLSSDLETALASALSLINFAVKPVTVEQIAANCFERKFDNAPDSPPQNYDMQTKHAAVFQKSGSYLYDADYTFKHVRQFVIAEMAKSV